MEQNDLLTINLSKQDIEDFKSFCKLNEITDEDGFVKLCFRKGYYIEKYGLLNQGSLPDVIEREFEKEVVKEVIVEKEVIIEKPVEDTGKIEELQNEIYILKGKLDDRKEAECSKLQQTLMVLNGQIGEKNETIEKLNKKIAELETLTKSSYAFYMKNSNLKDLL
jgi:hypothetical protein